MLRLKSFKPVGRRRRRNTVSAEALESRTLLSTFYVDGDYQGNIQDGSEQAPFRTIYQGIDAALSAPGDDTVIIQPKDDGPYNEATAVTPGWSLQQVRGFDQFNGDLVIRGGGASRSDVVIDTNRASAFYVDAPVEVTIENLTITQNGQIHDTSGILNRSQSPVTVDNVHVLDHPNRTGIVHQGADLTVRNSLLENNYQGLWAGTGNSNFTPDSLTVENTTARNNRRNGATVVNSTGVLSFAGLTATDNAWAGLRVWDSEVVSVSGGQFASNGRNGIAISRVASTTIDGAVVESNGQLDQQYYPGGGGIHVQPSSQSPVTISEVTVRGNRNWGNGGGIEVWAPQSGFVANVSISDSVIESNAVRQTGSGSPNIGGGIAINGTANLTLTGSLIAGNAAKDGGGIYFGTGYFNNGMSAALLVRDTTIRDNDASTGAGGLKVQNEAARVFSTTISGNSGRTGGAAIIGTNASLVNSTISGNEGYMFGGLYTLGRYGFTIANTTITANVGTRVGGLLSGSTTTQLANSIVAGNFVNNGEDFPTPGTPDDLGGGLTSLGHNIFGEAEAGRIISDHPSGSGPHSTDIAGTVNAPVDALLGPLQDNGGPTETHLPLSGSPAIDGGDAGKQGAPVIDQRGVSRPERGGHDIGSVEVENNTPVVSVDSEQVQVAEGQTAQQTGSFSDPDGDAVSLSVNVGSIVDNGDGTWSWSLTPDDGPGDGGTIVVTATDVFDATTHVSFDLNVNNMAPEVSISGPDTAVAGDPVNFDLTASDVSVADQSADFVYSIDWDSDGTVDETVTAGAQTTVTHTFSSGGSQTVTVTATDKDGGVSTAAHHTVLVSQQVTIETQSSINLNSADKGNKSVEVVIFSTAQFDARLIDTSTVVWAGAGVYRSSLKDVDRDGDLDLVLKFRLRETNLVDLYRTALSQDSSESRQSVSVGLTGRTTSGASIFGDSTVELFMTGRSLRDMLDSL